MSVLRVLYSNKAGGPFCKTREQAYFNRNSNSKLTFQCYNFYASKQRVLSRTEKPIMVGNGQQMFWRSKKTFPKTR
jgi:hypothetical protein